MKKAMKKAKTKTKSRTKAGTKVKMQARAKVTRPALATKSKEYRPEDLIRTNGSMEIDPNLMHMKTARAIAKSIKRSADGSKRLTHSPFHSALSTSSSLMSRSRKPGSRRRGGSCDNSTGKLKTMHRSHRIFPTNTAGIARVQRTESCPLEANDYRETQEPVRDLRVEGR
jgi:Protein of unknown function (DUF3175)